MREDAKAYLARKAAQLDLGRGEALTNIQKLLDKHYPNQTRARSLNGGVLKIVTPSSVVASELRLRQVELLKQCSQQISAAYPIQRLLIQITTITAD